MHNQCKEGNRQTGSRVPSAIAFMGIFIEGIITQVSECLVKVKLYKNMKAIQQHVQELFGLRKKTLTLTLCISQGRTDG